MYVLFRSLPFSLSLSLSLSCPISLCLCSAVPCRAVLLYAGNILNPFFSRRSKISRYTEKSGKKAIKKRRSSHLYVNILNFLLHSSRLGFMNSQDEQMSSILQDKIAFEKLSNTFLCKKWNKLYWLSVVCITFFMASWVCVHFTKKKERHIFNGMLHIE